MIKLGIVGAGRVSEVHVDALRQLSSAQATAICDIDVARAERRSREWGIPVASSLEELLERQDVDAVLVLTHADTHVDIAQQVLAAGKHVFVEKPVDGDPERILHLDQEARHRGLIAFPGHNYAYLPEFERLQRLVRNGSLGEVRALFVNYIIKHPEEVARDYSGVLDEVMIHHAYIAASVLGAPDYVVAGAPATGWSSATQEDQAWMTMAYGRTTAHGFSSFAMDDHSYNPWTFVVKVLGTEGSAVVDFRSAVFLRALGTLPVALVPYEETYLNELRSFIACIEGSGTPLSTMGDAAVAAAIVRACQLSRREGRYVYRTDDVAGW